MIQSMRIGCQNIDEVMQSGIAEGSAFSKGRPIERTQRYQINAASLSFCTNAAANSYFE